MIQKDLWESVRPEAAANWAEKGYDLIRRPFLSINKAAISHFVRGLASAGCRGVPVARVPKCRASSRNAEMTGNLF